VEKMRKEHPLGYEAKLKNAKLSYYKGEFTLAVEHLNILKEATTREIANDALDLSLLIQDNTVEDTLGLALQEYSKIELLIFQKQEDTALKELQNLIQKYPNHALTDEILFQKGMLLRKMGKFNEALADLENIFKNHGSDILGDDAYFYMGKIYEEDLKNKEKAKEIYQEFLSKYPSSVFNAEARKRFRILRGDFVN
jgi:TolA-binding protein